MKLTDVPDDHGNRGPLLSAQRYRDPEIVDENCALVISPCLWSPSGDIELWWMGITASLRPCVLASGRAFSCASSAVQERTKTRMNGFAISDAWAATTGTIQ